MYMVETLREYSVTASVRVCPTALRRKATEGVKLPFGGGGGLDSSVAATIFAVTDSLPSKSVGEAVQTITEKEIKSEVEVRQNTLCTYIHMLAL